MAAADYTTLAVDAGGNTYLAGSREVPPHGTNGPYTNIVVSKLNPSGNLTLLATFGGNATDEANGIALDPSGNIYVVGRTTSTDFPLQQPLQSVPGKPMSFRPPGTGFLVKLRPDGTVFYSTYFGGTQGPSFINAVAADSQGNAYVTGETFAPDYPRSAGLPQAQVSGGLAANSVAFFAKISPAGDKILYAGGLAATARYCGGNPACATLPGTSSEGHAIAVDSAGNAYIAGNADNTGLATTPGAFRTNGSGAFVAKVNASGTGMAYVTYLGAAHALGPFSNADDFAYAIAADAAGNAYVAGSTSDPAFPATPSAFQSMLSLASPSTNPSSDAFVAKLNPTGSAMVWATFLGGTGQDQAGAIAIDSAGDVWVSGITNSADFPAGSGVPGGPEFLVEFNPAGSALLYASRYPANTVSAGLAVDPGGAVHTAGGTGVVSTFTPSGSAAPRILGVANAAGGDAADRVAPAELISIYGLHLGVSSPDYASFDAAGFLPTTLAGVQVTFNGTPGPLLYVSDTQINAVVPLALANMPSASLRVTSGTATLSDFRLMADRAVPQVFRNADGSAAAINQDGSVNSPANPAPAGSFVSIWATGIGWAPGPDGQMATAADDFGGCLIHDDVTNQDIRPSYAGAAPGMVTGVVQINFQVSRTGTSLSLYANGKTSDSFSIAVSP
jgi:uncharacterized protein (TIGR03437 family)